MSIRTHAQTPEYSEGWERTFGKKEGDLPRLKVFELCPKCGYNTWKSIYDRQGQHSIECKHCKAKYHDYPVGDTGMALLGEPEFIGLPTMPEAMLKGDGPALRSLHAPLVHIDQGADLVGTQGVPVADNELLRVLYWANTTESVSHPESEQRLRQELDAHLLHALESFKGCPMRPKELNEMRNTAIAVTSQFLEIPWKDIDLEVVGGGPYRPRTTLELFWLDSGHERQTSVYLSFKAPAGLARIYARTRKSDEG